MEQANDAEANATDDAKEDVKPRVLPSYTQFRMHAYRVTRSLGVFAIPLTKRLSPPCDPIRCVSANENLNNSILFKIPMKYNKTEKSRQSTPKSGGRINLFI